MNRHRTISGATRRPNRHVPHSSLIGAYCFSAMLVPFLPFEGKPQRAATLDPWLPTKGFTARRAGSA